MHTFGRSRVMPLVVKEYSDDAACVVVELFIPEQPAWAGEPGRSGSLVRSGGARSSKAGRAAAARRHRRVSGPRSRFPFAGDRDAGLFWSALLGLLVGERR